MKESLDNNSKNIVFIAGLVGVLVAACGIISAVDKFAWGPAILNTLYFLCCIWLVYYQLSDTFSSKQLFISLIVTFSICVILRDLVFPAEGLDKGIEVFAGMLSVSEIASLVILNSSWKYVRRVKSTLIYLFIVDCIVSAIWTWNAVVNGSSEIKLFFVIMMYWSRTLIAFCLVYCYLARMRVKSLEESKITE